MIAVFLSTFVVGLIPGLILVRFMAEVYRIADAPEPEILTAVFS